MLMIAFIGVRISWLITARNALFARLAASAAAFASAISACAAESAARPESSARATSRSSPSPSGSPVRAERSPAFIRRAVSSSARVSRRKNRSAATIASAEARERAGQQDPEIAHERGPRGRSAVAVGMPIDTNASAPCVAGLHLRERVEALHAVDAARDGRALREMRRPPEDLRGVHRAPDPLVRLDRTHQDRPLAVQDQQDRFGPAGARRRGGPPSSRGPETPRAPRERHRPRRTRGQPMFMPVRGEIGLR